MATTNDVDLSTTTTGTSTGTSTGASSGTVRPTSTTARDAVRLPGRAPATRTQTLVTEQGSTSIADVVVMKIAGLAAREVAGVYRLGGSAARALGAVRERIPGGRANATQGVRVEVGERQAAVDLELMVEYGVSIADLAEAVRQNVVTSIESMTGLEVVEVNIAVDDIRLPEDDEDEPVGPARVQ